MAWRAALDRGAERIGWKIGLNIPEVQQRLGLREPVIGHLTSHTLLRDGGTYRAEDPADLRVECEIAVRVGSDGGVDAYAPALEIVDVGRPPAGGAAGIVADNVFHRAFALGAFGGPPGAARLIVNGEPHPADQPQPDFDATLDGVARYLGSAGEELRPGDVIIAGSLVHTAVGPGDRVRAELEGLGAVEVAIA